MMPMLRVFSRGVVRAICFVLFAAGMDGGHHVRHSGSRALDGRYARRPTQFSCLFPVARSGTAEPVLCYPVETELRKAAELGATGYCVGLAVSEAGHLTTVLVREVFDYQR